MLAMLPWAKALLYKPSKVRLRQSLRQAKLRSNVDQIQHSE